MAEFPLSRRTLLVAGGTVVTAGVAQSCAILSGGASHPEWSAAPNALQNAELTVPASELTKLKEKGTLLVKPPSPHPELLVAQEQDGTYRIVAADCTHQGCTVDFIRAEKVFGCPCHGSKFDLEGKVVNGPADEPLKKFSSRVEGDKLVIVLS